MHLGFAMRAVEGFWGCDVFTFIFNDVLSSTKITKHAIKFDAIMAKFESEESYEKASITHFTDVVGH
jgi:hypothetical protein